MPGIVLPKLRWLVIGAAAAGIWAMNQPAPKPRDSHVAETKTATRTAPLPSARQAPAQAPQQQAAAAQSPRGSAASAAAQTITDVITSSIPRPPNPVGLKKADYQGLVTSQVRMRKDATRSSAVVIMLKAGTAVQVTASKDEWLQVSAAGRTGWVHGDYIAARTGVPVAKAQAQAAAPAAEATAVPASPRQPAETVSQTSSDPLWGAMRPIRPPQGGDCQCPYDLMLNGKACGDHSAYMRKNASVQCYF